MAENFPIMVAGYRANDVLGAVRKGGQYVVVVSLPWAMIAPFEAAAHANHGQTLKRLAERGGLAASEALAVLDRRNWRRMTDAEAHQQLAARLNFFLARAAPDREAAIRREALEEAKKIADNFADHYHRPMAGNRSDEEIMMDDARRELAEGIAAEIGSLIAAPDKGGAS